MISFICLSPFDSVIIELLKCAYQYNLSMGEFKGLSQILKTEVFFNEWDYLGLGLDQHIMHLASTST